MTDSPDWLDEEAGPLVRNYALTGGRARPGASVFDLMTFVVTTGEPESEAALRLQPEHRTILAIAAQPISVAALASQVRLPLGVVRVLLHDLLELGVIGTHHSRPTAAYPDEDVLEKVIHGLRAR
jgi:hypothetical protein